jgi:transposase
MKNVRVIGLDLAKNIFQVHGADRNGKVVGKKTLRRTKVLSFFASIKPCLVGIEACGSSHYWSRELIKLGHEVKLMPPQYVKPYVKTNKNDAADAEAICEAVTRPNMRFVGLKTPEQQVLLLIHREREGVVKERTALINRLRSTLGEFGLFIPVGPQRLHKWFRECYGEFEPNLPPLMSRHIIRMRSRLLGLEREIANLDDEINQQSRENEACKRLEEVPGIGRLTASALVASIGNAQEFKSGRQLSAWLGLVPKQHSSGGKERLSGISKRGDAYLRRMLIHGARAVLKHMNPKRQATRWLEKLLTRAHRNVVIVALANKLARIAWALLSKGERYREALI